VVVIKMSGLQFGRKDFFNVVALLAASEAAEKSIQRVQAVHPVDNGNIVFLFVAGGMAT
jgi:hypothetical protein